MPFTVTRVIEAALANPDRVSPKPYLYQIHIGRTCSTGSWQSASFDIEFVKQSGNKSFADRL